jgi:hypothetical protein
MSDLAARVKKAVAIIDPPRERRAECATAVEAIMQKIERVAARNDFIDAVGSAPTKRTLKKLIHAHRELREEIRLLPAARAALTFYEDLLSTPDAPRHRTGYRERLAVQYAVKLLLMFHIKEADRMITVTRAAKKSSNKKGGKWDELAVELAGTGVETLSRHLPPSAGRALARFLSAAVRGDKKNAEKLAGDVVLPPGGREFFKALFQPRPKRK